MKRFLCLVLLVGLLSLAVTASAATSKTYFGNGYYFSYPSNWVQSSMESVDVVIQMPDGFSNINVSVTDMGMTLTPELFDLVLSDTMLELYQGMFNGVSKVEHESPATYGQNKCSVLAFTVSMFGLDMYMEQYALFHGTNTYLITATYFQQNSPYLEDVHDIVASFTMY